MVFAKSDPVTKNCPAMDGRGRIDCNYCHSLIPRT